MARLVSFIILVVILLVIGALFMVVMAGFALPLFIALLLAVMFQPVHRWFIAKCRGRFRLAAALTTASIALIVLLPLSAIFTTAVFEGLAIYRQIQGHSIRVPAAQESGDAEGGPSERSLAEAFVDPGALAGAVVDVAEQVHVRLSAREVEQAIRRSLDEWLGPLALGTARFMGKLLLILGVTVISTYYFLADGPWMIRKIMRLSPLEDRYEAELFEQFVQITRAVVAATLLSAVAQGLLAGLGFTLLGLPAVFLLISLTMLLALVPFVGAAAVWVPVCVWLFFFADPPRKVAAVLMGLYGAGVISMADNVIKPVVLHGRSNIHPLLALLSVIGGLQAMGPIGIFVGPMVVAFLHALLNMFHTELERMSGQGEGDQKEDEPAAEEERKPDGEQPTGPDKPVDEAARVEAEKKAGDKGRPEAGRRPTA